MVACADVDRSVSDRGTHCSCAELGCGAIYLYAVLGHSRAETNLAVMETSRSRDWDFSGAGPAYCLLCDSRASLWSICPLVFRSFADQATSYTMA